MTPSPSVGVLTRAGGMTDSSSLVSSSPPWFVCLGFDPGSHAVARSHAGLASSLIAGGKRLREAIWHSYPTDQETSVRRGVRRPQLRRRARRAARNAAYEIMCGGLAANGVPEGAAGLRHARVRKRRHPSTERSSGDRVDVVEIHDAIARNVITLRGELEFRYEIPLGSGERRHRHRPDPICDGITRQHEHGSIAARCRGEPDLTALHRPCCRPSQPSPLPGPNQRSRLAKAQTQRLETDRSDLPHAGYGE
jgi:hypothetical protein